MNASSYRRSPRTIPALLGLGSVFALIAALAAEGIWDLIFWVLLTLPLLAVGWARLRK